MLEKYEKALYVILKNAKDLNEEADLLYENGSTARAYSLYHLSFEEAGKFQIIHSEISEFIVGKITKRELNFKRLKQLGFENHKMKMSECFNNISFMSIISMYSNSGCKTIEEFDTKNEKLINEIVQNTEKLKKNEEKFNRLKNASLYVTYYDNEFLHPNEQIMTSDFFTIKKLSNLGIDACEKVISFIENKNGILGMINEIKSES